MCWGDVTADEMLDYERRYWAGPEHEGFHHVIDLQVANFDLDVEQALMLATHATPVNLDAYSGARTAVVVANDHQRFIAEAYRDARHAMCNPKIREVAVFFEVEAARTWVESSIVIRAGEGARGVAEG